MILLFFLFFAAFLNADEDTTRAARYFEAKEYAKALDLYEALLKQPRTPWERSAIQYNIGAVQLSAGHPAAAIAEWSRIPLGDTPFPLLARRIHTNIAIAKLKQLEQVDLNSSLAFEKGAFLLHEARSYVERAVKEECAEQKLEGAAQCTPAADLVALQSLIDEEFTKGIIQWRSFEQAHVIPTEGMEPQILAAHRLLDSYKLALIDDPLQEEALISLIEEQKQILKPFTEEATKILQQSLLSLQQGHPLTARFYLQKARFQLTKMARPAKRGSTVTLLDKLQMALDEQHQAIILNRLAERMANSEELDTAIIEGILVPQKAAVKSATSFKSAVYQQQIQGFKKKCQANPWSELLPLFDEGYVSALQASIEKPRPSLELQDQALQKWSHALQILHNPSSAKSSCKGSLQEQQKPSESQKKEAEKEEPVKLNEVLQNMQKMQQEDSEEKPAPKAPLKGERPW
jgi:hypothetical protein